MQSIRPLLKSGALVQPKRENGVPRHAPVPFRAGQRAWVIDRVCDNVHEGDDGSEFGESDAEALQEDLQSARLSLQGPAGPLGVDFVVRLLGGKLLINIGARDSTRTPKVVLKNVLRSRETLDRFLFV